MTNKELTKLLDALAADQSQRVMELAHDGAFAAHIADRFDDEHVGQFATCPHPDCEMMRLLLPERN